MTGVESKWFYTNPDASFSIRIIKSHIFRYPATKENTMYRYDDFITDDTVPIIIANKNGVIIDINRAFVETFRWPPKLLLGQPLSEIIPRDLRDSHNMGFSKYVITGQSTLLESPLALEIRCGDEEILLAEHLIVVLEKDGEELLAAKIVPR